MVCCSMLSTHSGKYIRFYFILILDLIDVFVDWYFYAKVKFIKPGLVYGPPEDTYKWAVFTFCVISILTLFIETIQNADDLRVKKKFPLLTQSFSNVLTIYFEDIPLLVLNLLLSVCRDGDVSVISLVKASLGIGVVCVRFLLMIVQHWIMEKEKNRFEFCCDFLATCGLILIACLSIAIQLLNTFPSDKHGLIQFKSPETFNRTNFIRDKYLNNIGIFIKWPPQDPTNTNQVYLSEITDIIEYGQLSMKFITNGDIYNLDKNYTLCIQKRFLGENSTKSCFQVINNGLFIRLNSTYDSKQLLNGFSLVIKKVSAMSFMYKVGYLDFNVKFFNSNESCAQLKMSNNVTQSMLTYARYILPVHNGTYFKSKTSEYSTCFNTNYDLIKVDKLWKTGIFNCESRADKSPKFNSNLFTNCII